MPVAVGGVGLANAETPMDALCIYKCTHDAVMLTAQSGAEYIHLLYVSHARHGPCGEMRVERSQVC